MKFIPFFCFILSLASSAFANTQPLVRLTSIDILRNIDTAPTTTNGDDYYSVVATDSKSKAICRVHVDGPVASGTSYTIAVDGSNVVMIYSGTYLYLRSSKSGPGLSLDCRAGAGASGLYIDDVNNALAGVLRLSFVTVEATSE